MINNYQTNDENQSAENGMYQIVVQYFYGSLPISLKSIPSQLHNELIYLPFKKKQHQFEN